MEVPRGNIDEAFTFAARTIELQVDALSEGMHVRADAIKRERDVSGNRPLRQETNEGCWILRMSMDHIVRMRWNGHRMVFDPGNIRERHGDGLFLDRFVHL